MNEIKCPHCKTVFQIDEQSYDSIAKQVRDLEFSKELQKREEQFNNDKKNALELHEITLEQKYNKENQKLKDEYTKTIASQNSKINELNIKLENINTEQANALKLQKTQFELQLQEEKTKSIQEIEKLTTTLETYKNEYLIKETTLKTTYDEKLKIKDEQIAYYKDFKARQSTKMIGESLEVHCNNEFNKLRPLFKNAYFEKDNDVKTGSKGDFIFRDYDDDGTEITSIMFEMKNEADMTATKHKNEDFLKELDKDRQEKKCEYAVLVSLLEIDNEYYNTGIVDVSYRYSKMYIIRPQFFIPLITLIRSMGLNTLSYKKQLELLHEENIDITNFEENLEKFKDDFGRNYNLASKKFKTAIEEIDKTIDHLQKTKDALLSSDKNLRIANEKIDSVTIKKLTHNNKSVQNMFANLKKDKNQVANILGDEIKVNSKNENGKNDTVN